MNNRDFRTAIRNQAFGVPMVKSNNLSGGVESRHTGSLSADNMNPRSTSGEKSDSGSSAPPAQFFDCRNRDRQQDQRDAEASVWNQKAQLQRGD